MVGGIYLIIDSAGGNIATSYASLIVYVLGGIILVLSFVGCFGTVIESRGLLCIFMYLSGIFCAVSAIASIICFAQASQMRDWLDANWGTIRLGLWPDFTGKYDKEYFIDFVQQYTNVLGFVMFAIAIILAVMYGAAVVARTELKKLRNAEKRLEAIIEKDEACMDNILHLDHATHHKWRAFWSDGSYTSRCVLKTSCVSCACIIMFIITGGIVVMVFNVQCTSLSVTSVPYTARGVLQGNLEALEVVAKVTYPRGAINIAAGQPGTVNFTHTITAFSTGDTTVEENVTRRDRGVAPNLIPTFYYSLESKPQSIMLGTDFTCQGATVDISVPPELSVLSMDLDAVADVVVDFSLDEAKSVRFSELRMKSAQGTVKLKHVEVRRTSKMFSEKTDETSVWGKHGDPVFKAESVNGDITMTGLVGKDKFMKKDANRFTCADFEAVNVVGLSQWADLVWMQSDVGMIDVESILSTNCDLKVVSKSPIFVKTTKVVGGVLIVDGRSKISVTNLVANGLRAIARGTGAIVGSVISTNDRNNGIQATAESGSVNFTNIASEGSIQVESTSGDIEIHIGGLNCVNAPGFAGNFQISTAGKVSIINKRLEDKDGVSTDNWLKLDLSDPDSKTTMAAKKDTDGKSYQTISGTGNIAGSIYCHLDGECGYRGELIISSKTANVRIVLLDAYAC